MTTEHKTTDNTIKVPGYLPPVTWDVVEGANAESENFKRAYNAATLAGLLKERRQKYKDIKRYAGYRWYWPFGQLKFLSNPHWWRIEVDSYIDLSERIDKLRNTITTQETE